jgi:hypothetical protein
MIVGDFNIDLEQYIQENNGRVSASKKSSIDIENTGESVRGFFETGKMYTYRYFTPNELKYDTNPIILSLGLNESKNLIGINLHYIPYDDRLNLINNVIRSYESIISKELNDLNPPRYQKSLDSFIWENVNNAYGRKYNLKYAVRQYRFDRIRKPKVLGYENWYLGAVNDENYFFGTNINEAQSLYYTNI